MKDSELRKAFPDAEGFSPKNLKYVRRLAELFPSVATEITDANGNPQAAIDFDALRELLGDVAEGQRECYQFTWPGKREAKLLARTPCDKTMRPERGKSVNWDETENLYIEGGNLDPLKLMRETYAGRVKLIYIDPPYNTGHDFIYDDDFAPVSAMMRPIYAVFRDVSLADDTAAANFEELFKTYSPETIRRVI